MVKDKESNFASAVIYVHNDEKHVKEFVEIIISTMEDNFLHSEIICVNDNSQDNSVHRIEEASKSAKSSTVSIINMSYFQGVELSMNAGMDLSIGDFVFEFDRVQMDFEPDQIMKIYRHSLQGYDIVSAIPNEKPRISSKIFYYIFHKFSDLSYEMSSERFRVLSRRVINRIKSMNRSIPYRKVLYANSGLKTAALKYDVCKTSSEIMIEKSEILYRADLAIDSLILFTDVGYKLSMTLSVLMMFIAVAMSIYSLAMYIVSDPVEGWTSTTVFLSVTFAFLFAILTIVVKYLQIIVGLIFKRKQYSFESINKLTK